MHILIWSGTFLLASIGTAIVELARMLGMPVALNVQMGVVAVVSLVVASGIALMIFGATVPAQQSSALSK